MTDIIKTNSTALTADYAARLMSGIAESRAATTLPVGKSYLRFLKDGSWVYGQASDEIKDGARWAINIMTLSHGWACWEDSVKIGEVMASMLKPMPLCPDPINGVPYKEQRGFELRGVGGDSDGVELIHQMTSLGGLRAIDGLLAEIHKQLRHDPAHPCPLVVLETDSYNNKKYGLTYTPIYRIVGWCDMDGNEAQPVAPQPVAAAKPGKPVAVDNDPPFPFDVKASKPAAQPAPVATAQLHTGQRRRPIVR
jgi:hypothetical protein